MAAFDINQIYQAQFGAVGQPMPTSGVPAQGTLIRCPLSMAVDGVGYQFPLEPLVSVFGKNTVIRNHVLKGRSKGTVKEYWSADDYSIEIKGIVIGDDPDRLPVIELDKIRYYCEARKAIEVSSPFLTLYGIQFLSIETFEFLHTPGYNNQAYIIKAYSDEPFELF
jgi:Domain of unknown function (DUF6046)